MRRAITTTLLLLAIGGPAAGSATAQDAASGFTTALASVPDTADVRGGILSWIDYQALLGSRQGAAHPASMADLVTRLDAGDPAARLWMAAMNGAASGSGRLVRYLLHDGADWPRAVGFDFTDVRSELAFGQPPGDGIVIEGEFDPGLIGTALSAREFTSTDAGPFTLWCRSEGCDEGLRIDVAGRDMADPFGGDLGRRQPLAVSAGTLLSSASSDTVDAMLAATVAGRASLADDATITAVAEALGGEGTPIQATLVPGTELVVDPVTMLGVGTSPEEIKRRLAELGTDFEPIPAATLLGIGDAATEAEQVVTIALAYPTLADARTAARVLPGRLDTMMSERTQQTWRQLLDERGVTGIDARAVELANGDGALALVTLHAPLAGTEPDPDTGLLTASSMLYRLFAQSIAARDTAWLAPTLPTLD